MWSNIGYVALGILFILMAWRRRIKYRAIEEYNLTLDDPSRRKGVPQHFGIYYTIGIYLLCVYACIVMVCTYVYVYV